MHPPERQPLFFSDTIAVMLNIVLPAHTLDALDAAIDA
jgi:hypothetical protein